MRYKVGVRVPSDLDPRMFIVIDAVDRTWEKYLLPEPVVTSWGDGIHGPNSYHKRRGRAIDVRTKTIERAIAPLLVVELRTRLAHLGVDVILEDFNGNNEHIHIEIDAKADRP